MKFNFYLKFLLTFAFLMFIFSETRSQAIVKGLLLDEAGGPVAFGAVSLLSAKDSSLVKGALTDERGAYHIEGVQAGQFLVLASYIGYENVFSPVFEILPSNTAATVDLRFAQKGITLNEAVVVAQRPFLEQKADRLVVNVSGSPVAAGGTAKEILQKVPGVVIVQDKITIGGSQNLQIWVDGKPSPYSDMNAVLQDMPGDQIEKIELITQPGAQFDAAGGPIINIVLKRNANLGFKATAALTLGGFRVPFDDVGAPAQNFYRLNPSFNFAYRNGKVNLFGDASFNQGTYFQVFKVNRYIVDEKYVSANLGNSDYRFSNLRFGADYYLSDETTIGASLRGWHRDGSSDAHNLTEVFELADGNPISAFITDNREQSKRNGFYANAFAKHEFGAKSGHTLHIDFDYNHFGTRNVNDLAIYPVDQPLSLSLSQQDLDQPVDIIVAKVDYAHPIDSTMKVEAGMKSSFATVDNSLGFYRNETLSELESNDFLYKENINAAYLNLAKTLGKFDFNAGIRAEQTLVNGKTRGVAVLDRNYLQWFPSASALYHFDQNLGIRAAYSRRVNRPGFWQQNPFNNFIDSLTYTRGNPELRPETTNSYQLNLTYSGQPVAGVSYYVTDDVIIENAPKLEGTKTFTVSENLAVQKRLEIQLNFPIKWGKWLDGYGGNQAIMNAYDADYAGEKYKASKWNWLAYFQLNASLPKDFKLEAGGFYLTKFLEEFLTIGNMGGVNMGISKGFAGGRGRIALNFNDIFYTNKTNAHIDFGNVRLDFQQRQFSRNLRLNLRYQFGNTKLKSDTHRSASETETSRVKVE